jgi:hypothetical protein
MNDQLIEDLIAVQIDRAPSHLPAEDGDALPLAIGQVHLLGRVLMIADTNVGRGRAQYDEPFPF